MIAVLRRKGMIDHGQLDAVVVFGQVWSCSWVAGCQVRPRVADYRNAKPIGRWTVEQIQNHTDSLHHQGNTSMETHPA